MSAAEWTILGNGLPDGTVKSGVTAGTTPPPGGGTFCFAFNSLDSGVGARGYAITGPGFGLLTKGVSIRGCVRRGLGAGALGFSPFLFAGLQTPFVDGGLCYMLGLSDDDPHRIVLAKGYIGAGVKGQADAGVLARGSETFSVDTWLHLRLDVIANANGENVLNCYRNNLETHPVGSTPSWDLAAGMSQVIDDIAQINTGSAPRPGGYCGYGFATSTVARRAYFDAIEAYKQV